MLLLIALLFSLLTPIPHVLAGDAFLTGSNTLQVTDYSIVKKGITSGNYIESDAFNVGGYQWTINFYPQGLNSSYSDSVSIMVKLRNTTTVVRAIFTHRLLDWNTLCTWSTDTPASADVLDFKPPSAGWGYYSFVKWSKLETSNYLRNDTLVIKTTIWVVEVPALSTMGNITTADVSSDHSLADA